MIKPLCKLQSYSSFSDKPMHYMILLVIYQYISVILSVYPLLYPVFASVPANCIPNVSPQNCSFPIKLLYLLESPISSPDCWLQPPPEPSKKLGSPEQAQLQWEAAEQGLSLENGHGNNREIIRTWLIVHGYVELPEGSGGYSFVFFLFNL